MPEAEKWAAVGAQGWRESSGPGPFLTRRIFLRPDGSRLVWWSRHHRKSLLLPWEREALATGSLIRRCLWMPGELNWWIGTVFALGSFLFGLGSLLCLVPALADAWRIDALAINLIYFSGSIPFTIAAYLQLFQAANSGDIAPETGTRVPPAKRILLGWEPRNIGWLSCALQFVGTLFFNLNTFDPVIPGLTPAMQNIVVWAPDLLGSVLFLVSGYLAFAETAHAWWRWEPESISWWVTFTNLLGCVAFMLSAGFSFIPPQGPGPTATFLAAAFTLLGAVGFLAGSLLMLPETAG
ncbi:MAG: hypothetical protein ACOYM3_24820 [Terrimicrobiaceae bacterium]